METQATDQQTDNDPLLSSNEKRNNSISCNGLSKIFGVVIVILVGVIIGLLAGYVFEGDDETTSGHHPQNICDNCKPDNFPAFAYMYAPHTAFTEEINATTGEPDINYDAIPAMAQTAVDLGINVLYIGGSNGQFYTMTMDERKKLVGIWVDETRRLNPNIFIIWMIASTELDDAKELAVHAGNVLKVDAIASLPPYYDYYNYTFKNHTNDELFQWFGEIIEASGNLPFFYYHLPSTTRFYPNFPNLMSEALNDNKLPMFSGIKYVSGTSRQWFEMVEQFGDDIALISWSSPQTQFFGSPGRGIGGVDYFMPTFRCIRNAFLRGDIKTALSYQQWQYDMNSLIYSTRCVYQTLSGVNMYNARDPVSETNQTRCEQSLADLEDAGFFDELEQQKNCPLFI